MFNYQTAWTPQVPCAPNPVAHSQQHQQAISLVRLVERIRITLLPNISHKRLSVLPVFRLAFLIRAPRDSRDTEYGPIKVLGVHLEGFTDRGNSTISV